MEPYEQDTCLVLIRCEESKSGPICSSLDLMLCDLDVGPLLAMQLVYLNSTWCQVWWRGGSTRCACLASFGHAGWAHTTRVGQAWCTHRQEFEKWIAFLHFPKCCRWLTCGLTKKCGFCSVGFSEKLYSCVLEIFEVRAYSRWFWHSDSNSKLKLWKFLGFFAFLVWALDLE